VTGGIAVIGKEKKMSRNNDKPFPCKDCRFRGLTKPEGGYLICRRNPPTFGDDGYEFPMVWLNGSTDCFAGEPIMQRSCDTCRMKTCCGIWHLLGSDGGFDLNGWYCSDWKEKE
jgi:hypothetical protein